MKTLTLVCRCGATRTFQGADTDDIIRQIDAQNAVSEAAIKRGEGGWADQAWDKERSLRLPPRHVAGRCPACLVKEQES